jgi:hypothetical protein
MHVCKNWRLLYYFFFLIILYRWVIDRYPIHVVNLHSLFVLSFDAVENGTNYFGSVLVGLITFTELLRQIMYDKSNLFSYIENRKVLSCAFSLAYFTL